MALDALLDTTNPHSFSGAITEMVARVQPGVVQVRSGQRGLGAGVILDNDGSIITNHHVVAAHDQQRGKIIVALEDRREFEARLLGSHSGLDLALLKIEAQGLPVVHLGDATSLRVGELVFAIGHPWGVRGVVTAGIISGLGETRVPGGNGRTTRYLRSDVRLAPGNSGGPLLNAAGEVIGINAMIFGGDLGVAIPGDVAADWVASLAGKRRSFLGAGVRPVQLQGSYAWDRRNIVVQALQVATLAQDGPAQQAGLQIGDIVLDVGGERLRDVGALSYILTRHSPGSTIDLRVLRGDNLITVDVRLGQPERN
ncbi:MAG TPA: trypsin-like peptidase domain-containing protein [Chloroflexia bacterium]|nr:trypsin-like peptidase domain-containing protein [Chloroflexia bacterium]